jgi:hypothetical protein
MRVNLRHSSIVALLCLAIQISSASEDVEKAALKEGRNYILVLASSSVSSDGSGSDIVLTPQPSRMQVLAFSGPNWVKVKRLITVDDKITLSNNQPFWLNLNYVVAYREIPKE